MKIKQVRVYDINDDYSVECETTVNNGTEFVEFYLTDGTNKYFCVGEDAEAIKNEDEEEWAYFIYDEYIDCFEEEMDVLNDYYEKKIRSLPNK